MHKQKSFYAFILSITIILIFAFYLNSTEVYTDDTNNLRADSRKEEIVNSGNEKLLESKIDENGEDIMEKTRELKKEIYLISESKGRKVDDIVQGNVGQNDNGNKENEQKDKNKIKLDEFGKNNKGIRDYILSTSEKGWTKPDGEIYVDLSEEEILKNMENVNTTEKNKEMALDVIVEKILYGDDDKKENLVIESVKSEFDKVQVEVEQSEKRYIENEEDENEK